MLNSLSSEALRFWHAAVQHRDVANKLLRLHERGATSSIEAYHAVYIGGYAIECAFKALYLSRVPKAELNRVIAGQFRELGHNLLGCYDSVTARFGIEMPRSTRWVFRKDVASKWRVEMRFSSGKLRLSDAKRFLRAVDETITWVEGVG